MGSSEEAGRHLADMCDEAGFRIGVALYETIEQLITEAIREDDGSLVTNDSGASQDLATILEARMRRQVAATLVFKFMQAMHGWDEVLGQAGERYEERRHDG